MRSASKAFLCSDKKSFDAPVCRWLGVGKLILGLQRGTPLVSDLTLPWLNLTQMGFHTGVLSPYKSNPARRSAKCLTAGAFSSRVNRAFLMGRKTPATPLYFAVCINGYLR